MARGAVTIAVKRLIVAVSAQMTYAATRQVVGQGGSVVVLSPTVAFRPGPHRPILAVPGNKERTSQSAICAIISERRPTPTHCLTMKWGNPCGCRKRCLSVSSLSSKSQ